MRAQKERGAALVLTLILLAVLSVMTVSLLFLSQSETWSTANYRLMSQARDGAEVAVNRAANFLVGNLDPTTGQGALQPDGFTYTPATTLTVFTNSGATSPVQYNAANVVLKSTTNDQCQIGRAHV